MNVRVPHLSVRLYTNNSEAKNTSRMLVFKKSTFFGGFFSLTQSIFEIFQKLQWIQSF